ncbi:dihydroneopterin aldolase / 2-amino-4-hydroxy-6-hydroxymethyldihydropteridine diphosphokinase [Pedococcus dokdonensis]|uniref:Bifunctional folate synthesis protein n=1 Tax=Pedococcus dokdonensis TaxID=443156 RepID=A0A1H0USZ1_9MICO|nr:2-amino-4-hydroxy-6-hydroxymethyldihydropteridine diphosphokinase [Pedococcus dokdonensis]SDP69419.1 dihydroneopterin aldolase / 2-amino-4-hydroxy-6-hydroxymethyldihydropteridine diphosphokinase [Pedococcus dokdonensis]
MTDQIVLKGISAKGFHGVLDFEKRDGQVFVVDVTLHVDLAPAGASDDLADTVNYAEVAGDVVALIEGEPLDLIEALAARIADRALARPLVEAVEVVVHKPEAPVGHPFSDVQVRVTRERQSTVVIAMGSNIGDSIETLHDAAISLYGLIDVVEVSAPVETDPVGGPEQPVYLNAVVTGTTHLAPSSLLAGLHDIELAHGRTREVRWGPRTLDLDLVQYGDPVFDTDVVMDSPTLTLPHPRAHERGFVLVPWLQADPEAVLRVDGEVRRVADLVAAMDVSGVRPGPDVDLLEGPW